MPVYAPAIVLPAADSDLVAAARAGDRAALDALLRRHHDRIYAICRRIAGNDADAADATQEAMISIVRRLDRFDGRSQFTTWVYRVATNACLDELRRRKRRAEPMQFEPAHEAIPREPGVAVADQVTDRLAIDRALATLPIEFRTAVVLRDLCQLDYAEIASVLDIPAGTVRSRIARGRAALADRLAGNPGDPTPRPTP